MSLPHVWRIQATISHSTCQVKGGRELIAIRYRSFYCGSRQSPVAPTGLVKKCMQASHIFQTLIFVIPLGLEPRPED